MSEKFLNLKKETDFQVQERKRVSDNMEPKRPTPRHIRIKMAKVKYNESILNAAREKQKSHVHGNSIRYQLNFLPKHCRKAKKEWNDIFKVLKWEKNLQHRRLYPARFSFRIEGEIKKFSNKQKLSPSILNPLDLKC